MSFYQLLTSNMGGSQWGKSPLARLGWFTYVRLGLVINSSRIYEIVYVYEGSFGSVAVFLCKYIPVCEDFSQGMFF